MHIFQKLVFFANLSRISIVMYPIMVAVMSEIIVLWVGCMFFISNSPSPAARLAGMLMRKDISNAASGE